MRSQEPGTSLYGFAAVIAFFVATASKNAGAALMAGVMNGLAALFLLFVILSTVNAWRHSRALARACQPSGLYPRFDLAHANELAKSMGRSAADVFIGVLDGMLLFLPAGHCLSIAKTGGFKTSALVFCNVLHIINLVRVGDLKQALILNDKSGEVTTTLWNLITDSFELYACFNAWGLNELPNMSLNLCQRIIDHAIAGSIELLDVIRQFALVLVPEPEKPAGDQVFFLRRARIIIEVFLRGLAAEAAAGREFLCNLVELRRRLTCDDIEHTGYLAQMVRMGGELGREAGRLLSMKEQTPKTYENCLAEAENALWIFSEDQPLAASIQHTDVSPKDIVEKSGFAGIVVPANKMKTHAVYVALMVQELAQAGLDYGRKDRGVRAFIDELGQLPRISNLSDVLTLGRSSGTFLWGFLQSESQLAKYGEDRKLFFEMADLRTFAAVQDKKDAEFLEFRTGDTTVVETNISANSARPDELSTSFRENRVPRFRKDEFVHAPWSQVFAVYRNHPVIRAELCPFWRVDSWRSMVTRPNPVEGFVPEDDPAIFKLKYRRK